MDKKFERKTEQKHPTNPTGNRNIETNKVDIDEKKWGVFSPLFSSPLITYCM